MKRHFIPFLAVACVIVSPFAVAVVGPALDTGQAMAADTVDPEGFALPSGNEPDPALPDEMTAAETAALEASTESVIPVDLSLWAPESYPPVPGFPGANWTTIPPWALECCNAQPTLFYSDFPALWSAVSVAIWSWPNDNDYIGIVAGFQPGDTSNPSADYLLVDWKQGTQWFDFGSPSCTPGSTADIGLAASRVFGVPTADEFWGHENFDATCSDLNNGLAELARGNTLGDSGWASSAWNYLRLEYTPNSLKVYSAGNTLEMDIRGTFSNGRWAFYNFSQASTYYWMYYAEFLPVPAAIDIKPGSDPNAININGHGVIPVAILGSADFDVTWVDVDTLSFAGLDVNVRGKGAPQCSTADVSGLGGIPDGYNDLVCQFADDPGTWLPGDGFATLTGDLLPEYGGVSFEASDEIKVVP